MSTTNPRDVLSEWDELQIKYGNYAPRKREVSNEELSRAALDAAEQVDILDGQPLGALEQLEDEIPEETLELYRARRLAELKSAALADRYGSMVSVTEANYVAEVTDASRSAPGQVVLLLLFSPKSTRDGQQILCTAWQELAARHRYVKFCRAVGSEVIDGFPESRCPTVLIYREGSALHTFTGTTVWGGDRASTDSVEWVLFRSGVVRHCRSTVDPRPAMAPLVHPILPKQHESVESSDGSDDDRLTACATDRNYSSLALENAFRIK